MRESALRPCLDGQQQSLFVKFSELLGLRTETRPDRDHEVGMFLMDVLDHLFAIRELLREEVHRVPQVVATPVLPVLDDAVEGDLQLTILINDTFRFAGCLITLLRLPVTIGPERKHRHVTRQVAHLCNDAICTAAIHEVIVDALAGLRVKGHAVGIVLKQRRGVVLPIESPALDALEHVLEVLEVRLFHTLFLSTTIHLSVLDST